MTDDVNTAGTRGAPAADLALAVALGALAVGYGWLTSGIPSSPLEGSVGARALPHALTAAMLVLSLALFCSSGVRWIRRRCRSSHQATPASYPRELRNGLTLLCAGLAYLFLLPWLGYGISMALLLAGAAAMLERRFRLTHAAYGVGGAAVLYLLFVYLLGIPFPSGLVFAAAPADDGAGCPIAAYRIAYLAFGGS